MLGCLLKNPQKLMRVNNDKILCAMEKFRLILDKIQDCIEMQNGATESQLKTIWNDLSDAISESERRQKADTGERQSNIPDVSGSAWDLPDGVYQVGVDKATKGSNPNMDEKGNKW